MSEPEKPILIPPPEIKTIIDKLVKKISGQPKDQADQFVQLILQNDPTNPKFAFLRSDEDPYRPYYNSCLEKLSVAEVEAPKVEAL